MIDEARAAHARRGAYGPASASTANLRTEAERRPVRPRALVGLGVRRWRALPYGRVVVMGIRCIRHYVWATGPVHEPPRAVGGLALKSNVHGSLRGGGTQARISRNVRGLEKIPACIAGVRVTRPNRS